MDVFTSGYQGATPAEAIATLKRVGVELLADIRAVSLSRRPGFCKNALANGLRAAGIDYLHLKALGTPPEGREAAVSTTMPDLRRFMRHNWKHPKLKRRWRSFSSSPYNIELRCFALNANQSAVIDLCSCRQRYPKPRSLIFS